MSAIQVLADWQSQRLTLLGYPPMARLKLDRNTLDNLGTTSAQSKADAQRVIEQIKTKLHGQQGVLEGRLVIRNHDDSNYKLSAKTSFFTRLGISSTERRTTNTTIAALLENAGLTGTRQRFLDKTSNRSQSITTSELREILQATELENLAKLHEESVGSKGVLTPASLGLLSETERQVFLSNLRPENQSKLQAQIKLIDQRSKNRLDDQTRTALDTDAKSTGLLPADNDQDVIGTKTLAALTADERDAILQLISECITAEPVENLLPDSKKSLAQPPLSPVGQYAKAIQQTLLLPRHAQALSLMTALSRSNTLREREGSGSPALNVDELITTFSLLIASNQKIPLIGNNCETVRQVREDIREMEFGNRRLQDTSTLEGYFSGVCFTLTQKLKKDKIGEYLSKQIPAPGSRDKWNDFFAEYFKFGPGRANRGMFGGSQNPDKKSVTAVVIGTLKQKPAQFSPSKNEMLAAVLKGSGPYLQKYLQLTGDDVQDEDLRKALRDLKENCPPIRKDLVEAQLSLLKTLNPDIKGYSIKKSLGAATVSEAFLVELEDSTQKKSEVVVKCLRPGIRERAIRERKQFETLMEKEHNPGLKRTLQSTLDQIDRELNFEDERRNIMRAQEAYGLRNEPGIGVVTLADTAVVGNSNLLVLNLAKGQSLNQQVAELELRDLEKGGAAEDIAAKLTSLTKLWIQELLLGSGFFHGDLHSGNMIYNREQLTMIDFGNAGLLSRDQQRNIFRVIANVSLKQPQNLASAFQKLTPGMTNVQRNSLSTTFQTLFDQESGPLQLKLKNQDASLITGTPEIVNGELKVNDQTIDLSDLDEDSIRSLKDYCRSDFGRVEAVLDKVVQSDNGIPESIVIAMRSLIMLDNNFQALRNKIDSLQANQSQNERNQIATSSESAIQQLLSGSEISGLLDLKLIRAYLRTQNQRHSAEIGTKAEIRSMITKAERAQVE